MMKVKVSSRIMNVTKSDGQVICRMLLSKVTVASQSVRYSNT